MVKFKYHPLVKFAAFLLLILAIEVCAFSLWEIAASFAVIHVFRCVATACETV